MVANALGVSIKVELLDEMKHTIVMHPFSLRLQPARIAT